MNIANAFAWSLVGICIGIAIVGLVVIVVCLLERFADRKRVDVLKQAMRGGKP